MIWRENTNIRPHGRGFIRLGDLAPGIFVPSLYYCHQEMWRRVVWYVQSFRGNFPLPHSTLVTSCKTIKFPISRRFGSRFSQKQRNLKFWGGGDIWNKKVDISGCVLRHHPIVIHIWHVAINQARYMIDVFCVPKSTTLIISISFCSLCCSLLSLQTLQDWAVVDLTRTLSLLRVHLLLPSVYWWNLFRLWLIYRLIIIRSHMAI